MPTSACRILRVSYTSTYTDRHSRSFSPKDEYMYYDDVVDEIDINDDETPTQKYGTSLQRHEYEQNARAKKLLYYISVSLTRYDGDEDAQASRQCPEGSFLILSLVDVCARCGDYTAIRNECYICVRRYQ